MPVRRWDAEWLRRSDATTRAPAAAGRSTRYKKCHIDQPLVDPRSQEFQDKAWAIFDGKIAAEARHKERFGAVRPIIHADAWGKKLVVVGSRIYFNHDPATSFPDFLQAYLRDSFGAEWWREEASKPVIARHPVAQWQHHAEELMKGETPDERGRYSIPVDGAISAFMSVAYDLYIVRDNVRFQESIVERLKRRDSFSGMRYELLVAATFVRAGFSLEPEDEGSQRTHPEFVATHNATGFVVAVEAKARNRRQSDLHPAKAGVYDLIVRAASQGHDDKPFALVVDVAMPPEAPATFASWAPEVDETVKAVVEKHGGKPGPFDCVIFTSFTYPGGLPVTQGLTAPMLGWQPHGSRMPPGLVDALLNALERFARIPEFDTGS
jgi:hypothetical protein